MKRPICILCLLLALAALSGCGKQYATGSNASYATSGGVFYYATSGNALPFSLGGLGLPVASSGNAG